MRRLTRVWQGWALLADVVAPPLVATGIEEYRDSRTSKIRRCRRGKAG
ncbi:MAG TPA: hypothetical protein VM600_09460 [Actinomycetota bacterium]|nr:hypothetical protein [Actinomycetota bacterium]